MSEQNDPRRLLDEGDPAFAELESGLREARSAGPSAEQRARMRAALGLPPAGSDGGPGLDPPEGDAPGAAGASGANAVSTAYPAWLKWLLGGAFGLAAAFGVLRTMREAPPVASRPRELPRVTAPALPQPAASEAAGPAEPSVAPSAPSAPAAAEPAPAAAERARAIDPQRRGRTAVAQPRPVAATPRSIAEPDTANTAEELALLKRAKAHARSAPQRALALLSEHEQRFANGALAQEREVIAIEALLAANQRAEAESRAARFFQRYPDSAHARRVRALLDAPVGVDSDAKPRAPAHPSP